MSVSIFSITSRGLRNLLKRKSLFVYCKGKGTDFYFVHETHSSNEDEKFWRSQWGNDIWFAHGSNRAAGVVILKGTFKGHVLSHETDHSGRLVILEVNVDQSHYILVNSYATNNKQQNNILWKNCIQIDADQEQIP